MGEIPMITFAMIQNEPKRRRRREQLLRLPCEERGGGWMEEEEEEVRGGGVKGEGERRNVEGHVYQHRMWPTT